MASNNTWGCCFRILCEELGTMWTKGQPTPNRKASYSPIICYFIFADSMKKENPIVRANRVLRKKNHFPLWWHFFLIPFTKFQAPGISSPSQPAAGLQEFHHCHLHINGAVCLSQTHTESQSHLPSPQLDIYSVHAIHCLHIAPRPGWPGDDIHIKLI